MAQNDTKQIENWKLIIEEYLKTHKKIDDEFIEKMYGKKAQAKFIGGANKTDEDKLIDAMIMNGFSGIDCRDLDFSELSLSNYSRITFDSSTQFPDNVSQAFSGILNKSKEFGFGLEGLIESGRLSGEGINIAIIDENFDSSTINSEDLNIVSHITHEENSKQNHFHGKTTTSLLASKSCGVAKGANIFFFEKTGEAYRTENTRKGIAFKQKEEYLSKQNWKTEEDLKKAKKQLRDEKKEDRNTRGNLELEKSFRKIIEHNMNCTDDKDKITVLSGSWSISPEKKFEEYQEALRNCGCELVCQNNLMKYFTQITSNGDVILDMTPEEKEELPSQAREMLKQKDIKDFVKVPVNRAYHQFGTDGFKYQASFSNSWTVPQVAGLLALYKAKDKTLTFDEFASICKETSKENGIINPEGIYEKVEKRLKNVKQSRNVGNQNPNIEDDEGR